MSSDKLSFRGTVSRVISRKDFGTVGILQPEGTTIANKEIKYKGKIFAKEGDIISIVGHWTDSDKFGKTFQVTEQLYETEITESMLVSWLGIHGKGLRIGDAKAKKIAKEFGDKFDFWLEEEPQQIAIDAQVPLASVLRIAELWKEDKSRNHTLMRLQQFGVTKRQVDEIYTRYSGASVDVVTQNPYRLIKDIDGISFRRADAIAKSLGWAHNHPVRISAGILYFLERVLTGDIDVRPDDEKDELSSRRGIGKRHQGSTCLARMDVQDLAAEILEVVDSPELIESQIDKLIESGEIVDWQGYLAIRYIFCAESHVSDFLKRGGKRNIIWDDDSIEEALDACTTLDFSQREAIRNSLTYQISLISGGAGTGKSTLIAKITELYQRQGKTVALAAPTGKAARRLTELVRNCEGETIHRLLEYAPQFNRFMRDESSPLMVDVVIIDEVSMLDINLSYSLFRAISSRTSVILVGDHNQLPPVGPGALLRDIIKHNLIPMAILTHCHRQSSMLKTNASLILKGELAPSVIPEQNEVSPWMVKSRWVNYSQAEQGILADVKKLFQTTLLEMGYCPIQDTQFLTANRDSGGLSVKAINRQLQAIYQASKGVTVEEYKENESDKFYLGDKVIQTKNSYTLGIMNGYQGIVVSVDPLIVYFNNEIEVEIPIDCRGNLSLAYCITVHKSQGSEFPCVVVIAHRSALQTINRNWFYTACTRARKTCIVLGDDRGLSEAVNCVMDNTRCTLLPLL